MFPGRPIFRSKRGNRCTLLSGRVFVIHCPKCGITKPNTSVNRGSGHCKRCGGELEYRSY